MRTLRTLPAAAVLLVVLSISNTWAQVEKSEATAGSQQRSNPKTALTPATAIAASDPVVTIHGLCRDQSIPLPAASACTTVVTREEFETLLNSMNVTGKTLTPETRRNLAETYAHYLAMEPPATQAGLETTPRFAEIMRWWRLRSLADMYRGKLEEEFKNPSEDEIHAYYTQHLLSYQRIQVARIVVPRTPGATAEAKRADEKALQAANSARARLARGEDPDLVQKDTYSALGLSSAPITNLGTNPRSSFPTEETDELFALDPGQISKVETEGASYVIYKLASKDTLSEDSVKDEISRQIAQDKFNEALRNIDESARTELNESYFGPPEAAPPVVYSGQSVSPHP